MEIEFDPEKTSYEKLLSMFWKLHNSTQPRGRQYMSAIFFHSEDQREQAELGKKEEQAHHAQPIVTVIEKAGTFYNAEDYHQKWMLRHYPHMIESLGLTDEELITSTTAARLNGYLGGNGTVEELEQECASFGLSRKQLDVVRKKVNSRI